MIDLVVLICPSTSRSNSGLVLLIPTRTLPVARLVMNTASSSSAPDPMLSCILSVALIVNDLTDLYDIDVAAAIKVVPVPEIENVSSSTTVIV